MDYHQFQSIHNTVLPKQLHLFDIDVPGEFSFMESDTLTAGETPTIVDTGMYWCQIRSMLEFSLVRKELYFIGKDIKF